MSLVTEPVILDRTGQIIADKLQGVIDAINGGTIDPLTVTRNGTYTPSGTTLGYGPVTVNVPSGGVALLTRAEWDALTTAQKQAYGLVAIEDTTTGFDRGELVYGGDYVPVGIYLPASDESTIVCEAYADSFDPGNSTWGFGANPIIMQEGLLPTKSDSENAVYLGVQSTDKYAYVDLGLGNSPYTVYAVMKLVSPGSYTRLLSSMSSRSSGAGMLLFGSTIHVSSWASDTSTGISSVNYVAVAMQYSGASSGAGIVTSNGDYITKSPNSSSRYLTIGRTDITPSGSNAEPANLYLRYLGVSTAYETEAQIRTNLANLESVFIT